MTGDRDSDSGGGRISDPTLSIGDEAYCPTCDESFDITTESCPNDGTRLVAFTEEPDELVGQSLDGRFSIDERIGAGGMGTVYRARQSSIGRDVAIKVIHPARTRDRGTAKRFLREARLASRLTHPNTVVVHDVGQADNGALYIAMELVDGVTLKERIRQSGKMSVELAVEIARQLCDALGAAHALGIIHRDLKPANIMLVGGVVKVLDFGLAKSLDGDASTTELTDSDQIMGTPAYISPEMVRGEALDERSDLYSLGCVLYEMIAGEPPFVAANTSAVLGRHLEDAAPRLDAPPAIADLVAALLAKQPAKRPRTAAAVKRALAPAGEPPESEPAAPRRWPLMLGAGAVVAAAAVTAALIAGRDPAPPTPAPVPEVAAATPDAPDPAPAPVSDAAPVAATVEITFDVSPAGARVELPGGAAHDPARPLALDRGDAPVRLRFAARGYRSATRTITPARDQTVEVELRPRRARPTAGPGSGSGSGPPEVPFR